MYRNEFDNILRNKTRNSSYLFYGESNFLIDMYIKNTIESLGIDKDEVEKIYHDEYDFKYVKNQLSQSSLFASNNCIVIKSAKKIPKKDMEQLVESASSNSDSVVIFALFVNERLAPLEKLFTPKNDGVVVRFFNPKPYEAIQILAAQANKLSLKFTGDAMSHLYSIHEEDLSLCINDLNKLYILDQEITPKIVSKYCSGLGEVSIDGFLHKLLDNQNISKEIDTIVEEGLNEVMLISQISSFIQQLFMINSYSRVNGFPNSKDILGYIPPKDVWEKKTRLASKIKPKQYLEMLKYYGDIELDLKTDKELEASLYLSSKLRKHSVIFR